MSRAREFADLAGSADAGGITGRNVLINGEFQVWQRGTSSSSVGYNTADRWRLHLSGASATASQGTFANGQTAVPGNPQFYMALNVTTGNDNAGLQYRHEGTQQLNGEVYTLSFWAKSATPATMTVGSHSYDASADVDDDNTVSPSTFTPTSSWQKFTFKITHSAMPNLGAYANGDYTLMSIGQGSSTSTAAWKLDLALVQFEKGEQATPFEHRSFGDELARCQRYYQKSYNYSVVPGTNTQIGATYQTTETTSSYASAGYTAFSVRMRASPTITSYDYAGNSGKFRGGADNIAVYIQAPGDSGFGNYANNVSIGAHSGVAIHYEAAAEL